MKTISIQLPDETERQLQVRASASGASLEGFLAGLAECELKTPNKEPDQLAKGIAWLTNRTTSDVESARVRLLANPVHSLPPGKSLVDVVEGTWPGDETDTQIRAALEHLS